MNTWAYVSIYLAVGIVFAIVEVACARISGILSEDDGALCNGCCTFACVLIWPIGLIWAIINIAAGLLEDKFKAKYDASKDKEAAK